MALLTLDLMLFLLSAFLVKFHFEDLGGFNFPALNKLLVEATRSRCNGAFLPL